MKKVFLALAFICGYLTGMSQENMLRKIDVPGNSVSWKELIHASIYFQINGKNIYVDPWGEEKLYKDLPEADAIVITDIHPDHYSVENIERIINDNTFFIVPPAVYEKMSDEWKQRCSVLRNGEQNNFKDIRLMITAIPMYNIPEGPSQPHQKGRGNGYVFDIDGFQIYISGDTENTPESQALENIDVAFVCMNLPYTMSVDEAIALCKVMKPKKVIPYHYRNGDKTLADIEHFCQQMKANGIRCAQLNWYPE